MKSGVLHKPLIISGLYHPVYILPPGEIYPAIAVEKNNYAVCIDAGIIKSADKSNIVEIVSGNRPFLLYFSTDIINEVLETGEKPLEKLTLLFLSENYLFIKEKPVIVIVENSTVHISDAEEKINSFIQNQGLSGLTTWKISQSASFEEQVKNGDFPLYIKENADINEASAQLFLANPENLGNYILFKEQDNNNGTCTIPDHFNKICANYLKGNSMLKTIIGKYLRSKQIMLVLEKENRLLHQRLTTAHSFVELAKSKYKDDYDELFTFYHNEYEILPLWYKRFGHIVKVLMGKRSFRSLFSDNVKKYKD